MKTTNKCEWCGRRYRLHDWNEGIELEICFTCRSQRNYVKSLSERELVDIVNLYLHLKLTYLPTKLADQNNPTPV